MPTSRATIRTRLTSRRTAQVLIGFALALVLIAIWVPQQGRASVAEREAWATRWGPWLAAAVRFLGLDRVFSGPWLIILALALVAMIAAMVQSFRVAAARTRAAPEASPKASALRPDVSADDLRGLLRRKGYVLMSRSADGERYVKYPWGYWGGFVLHVGMVTSLLAILAVVGTEQRGGVGLALGQTFRPQDAWDVQVRDWTGAGLRLPWDVRLDAVRPTFWPTGELRRLESELTLFTPKESRPVRVGVNSSIVVDGIRIYQDSRFGRAFVVAFTDASGATTQVAMRLLHPPDLSTPSRDTFEDVGIPFQVDAKYLPDADMDSMASEEPLLTLRLRKGARVVGEARLRAGQEARLGPYRAALVAFPWWSRIIAVSQRGVPLLSLGFALILVGGAFVYLTPFRETTLVSREGSFTVSWKGSRFAETYADERVAILSFTEARAHEPAANEDLAGGAPTQDAQAHGARAGRAQRGGRESEERDRRG